MNSDYLQALLSDAESYMIEARKGDLRAALEARDAVNYYQTLRQNGKGEEPWEAADDYAGDIESEAIDIIERLRKRRAEPKECGVCKGQGSTACSFCSGSAEVTCQDCKGAGRLPCPLCLGRKQVIVTLAIRQTISRERQTVRCGTGGLTEEELRLLAPSASDLGNALDQQSDYEVVVHCAVSTPGSGSLPPELENCALPPDLRAAIQGLLPAATAKAGPGKRILKQVVRIKEAKVVTVRYRYAGKTYECKLVGRTRALAPVNPLTEIDELRRKSAELKQKLRTPNWQEWLRSSPIGKVLLCAFFYGPIVCLVLAMIGGVVVKLGEVGANPDEKAARSPLIKTDPTTGAVVGVSVLCWLFSFILFWAIASFAYRRIADKEKLQQRLDRINAPLLAEIRAAEAEVERLLQPDRDRQERAVREVQRRRESEPALGKYRAKADADLHELLAQERQEVERGKREQEQKAQEGADTDEPPVHLPEPGEKGETNSGGG